MRNLFIILALTMTWSAFAQVRLDETRFPAAGKHATMLQVERLGRYSFTVDGGFGVTLAMVDAMSGPQPARGELGRVDGRLDLILDAGTYKIQLEGPSEARGQVNLHARAFELPAGEPQPLEDLVLADTQLDDFQQRQYWIVLDQPETLRLELLGRNLADAKLWLAGMWLTGAPAQKSVLEPVSGHPMNLIEFNQPLPAGQYLLTCYGGPAQTWADGDDSHPLYLRRGVRVAGVQGRYRMTVSPFGRERLIVPGQADYFEVRRADKADTVLTRSDTLEAYWGRSAYLFKDSSNTIASLDAWRTDDNLHWLTVQTAPGSEIELQHFAKQRDNPPTRQHSLVTTQAAFARESCLEPTGFAYTSGEGSRMAVQFARLGNGIPFARRTQLTANLELYLDVLDTGEYLVEALASSTTRAEYRFQPLFHNDDYTPPSFRDLNEPAKLAAGRYMFELQPRGKGILNFSLHARNDAAGTPLPPEKVAQTVQLDLDLSNSNEPASVLVVGHASQTMGWTVRPVPLELGAPLPFSLAPGAAFASSFVLTEPALLRVEGENAQLALDGATVPNDTLVSPGTHRFIMRNTGDRTGFFQLSTVRKVPTAKPLPLAAWLNPAQQPATMTAAQPRYFDLSAATPAFFLLSVDKPGLYRLETSGRLQTSLVLRSRVDTNLFSDNGGGVGRNALVQQYLRPGTYLVSASALGASNGRCGLHLRRTELIQSEPLEVGAIRRHSLREDEAVQIPFTLDHDSTWIFRGLGLENEFGLRIEDKHGFPMLSPSRVRELALALPAGDYRMISLPEAVPSRRLFQFEEQPAPRDFDGKGPFDLRFNQPYQHVWRVGEPDQYRLQVPAELELSLQLSADMRATFSRDGQTLATAIGGQPFSQKFSPGPLHLSVQRLDPGDRFPYALTVTTNTLCSGVPRVLTEPGTALPVSIAGEGLVRIQSFGARDVAGVLRTLDGTVVASADESPDDWNFKIMRNLAPGHYLLDITQRGAGSGPLRIDLEEYPSETQAPQKLPFAQALQLAQKVAVLPLRVSERQLAQFRTRGNAHFALLRDQQSLLEGSEGQLVLEAGGDYRLIVWSEAERPGQVNLEAERLTARDRALGKAEKLTGAGTWHLTDAAAGSWWVDSPGPVLYAEAPDRPFLPLGKQPLNLFSGEAWLIGRDLALRPVVAETGRLELPLGRDPLTLRLQAKPDQAALVVLDGASSHPAAQVKSVGAPALPIAWSTMTPSEHGTVLGLPSSGTATLRMWPLTHEPGTVRLDLRTYPLLPSRAYQPETGALDAGKALRLTLDTGLPAVKLLLGQGLVAVYQNGETVAATLAAMDRHLAQTLPVQGGSLTLINTAATTQIYELAAAVAEPALALGVEGYERLFDQPGHLRFSLQDQPGRRLAVLGDALTLRMRAADGRYFEGEDQATLPATAAELELEHGPGLVKLAYLDASDQRTLWQTDQPARGPLPDQPFDLGEGGTWTLALSAPSLIRIQTRSAVVTLPGLERHAGGMLSFAAYLPAGQHQLSARPLAGTTGVRLAAQLTALRILGKEAPWTLIGEGDSHGWTFTVSTTNKVGVGLACDADRLEAALYDNKGTLLSTSPFYLGDLAPGDYVLIVSGHGAPVRYRPMLLGAEGPGQAIPEEVLQSYLNPTKADDENPRPDDTFDEESEGDDEGQE